MIFFRMFENNLYFIAMLTTNQNCEPLVRDTNDEPLIQCSLGYSE